jgi:serine phosphatase RsbU (regulator of sigma subunit)
MNGADDMFGELRLRAIVEEYGDGPAEQLRERILREIRAFTAPEPPHDDMTMLLINVGATPAVA